jgi:uncharacterized membrane protein YcfT
LFLQAYQVKRPGIFFTGQNWKVLYDVSVSSLPAAVLKQLYWILYKNVKVDVRCWKLRRPCVWLLIAVSVHNEISEG